MKNQKTEFWKVMGLGDIDYEFTLNLSEPEAKLYKFDIEQANSLKDCKNLLQIEDVKEKITISSKNNLVNLLLFVNKTNQNKIFVEFVSLNCLFLTQDMAFIKDKIKQDFDENFLFLIESNIKQPCKFKLNVNVQNKPPKSFEMELQTNDKKLEEKKPEEKKTEIKTEQKKSEEKKPEEKKPEEKKPEEKKIEEKKPEETKGKKGNIEIINSIALPTVEKPDFKIPKQDEGVEGKDDEKIAELGIRNNILNQLRYEFENCDYVFIDLNKFVNYSDINLSDLYDFLYYRIIHLYLNTSIVLIFPSLDENFKTDLLSPLVDLISISDIVIYDKKDAQRLCTLLGYKVEDKNFEVRFMFLKELKRGKSKPQKTSLFLDDFHKLTVVMQETESNLIIFHNEFNFEIGFKLDFFKTVTNNYEFLKYVFYGGFFSRVIENKPFDEAFQVGLQTFQKMLDILHNNQAIPNDPEFFLIKNKKPEKKEKKITETKTSKKTQFQHDMSSNSPSGKYAHKGGYMSSSDNLDDSYGYSGASPKNTSMNSKPNKVLDIEQKKLLTILEANEIIQQKLNKLLSRSPGAKQGQFSDDEFGQTKLGKKLPGIRGGESNPFSKMSKPSYKSSYERKKNLKPISKETYDRLTGFNKISNYEPMSYTMGFNQKLTKEEQYSQMKRMNQMNQTLVNQSQNKSQEGSEKGSSVEKKKEEKVKKEENSKSPKKEEKNGMGQFDMSKIDPAVLQNFMMMTQGGMNPNMSSMGGSPNNTHSLKKPHFSIQRHKNELEPICNLGFIPQQVDKEKELKELEEKNRKKFRGPEFFDSKHNKSKFKYLEEQKKEILLDEINKSVDEKGRKEDYDDLKRSQEKAEKEKQRIENERVSKEKADKEKAEKEKKEKEDKEKEKKENEKKKEDKDKEDAKKTDEVKKEEKKEEKK